LDVPPSPKLQSHVEAPGLLSTKLAAKGGLHAVLSFTEKSTGGWVIMVTFLVIESLQFP